MMMTGFSVNNGTSSGTECLSDIVRTGRWRPGNLAIPADPEGRHAVLDDRQQLSPRADLPQDRDVLLVDEDGALALLVLFGEGSPGNDDVVAGIRSEVERPSQDDRPALVDGGLNSGNVDNRVIGSDHDGLGC